MPGMIELPGSFSGSDSSPSPERGPEPRKRMSLAILVSATARVLSAPWKNTSASLAASCSNLFGAVSKRVPAMSVIAAVMSSAQPAGAFSPVPTAVPPIASVRRPFSASRMRRRQLASCAA